MEPFNPRQFLVLVVDDSTNNLRVVGTMLDAVGYITAFATSGKEALERVKVTRPDLILLDLMMPEMDGLETCEHLQAIPDHREIPVIFLTASNNKDNLIQAFERGAVDYITKPFNDLELLARVKTHLELKHTRDELRKALADLEKLATTDPLTGIPNRRHLLNRGQKELTLARQGDRPVSVLSIDIDRFKNINDTYGHAVGDEALKVMVDATLKALREEDSFGRFGGEEFLVFLPETNTKEAANLADCIRRTIAEASVPVAESNVLQLTVSIGVATYWCDGETIESVLKKADDALYQAKNNGRDRVVANAADLKTSSDNC